MSGFLRERGNAVMYRKKAGGWLKHLDFIVLDALCIQAAFFLAYAVRMGPSSPYHDDVYRGIGAIILLAHVAVVVLAGSFSGVLRRGHYRYTVYYSERGCLFSFRYLSDRYALSLYELFYQASLESAAVEAQDSGRAAFPSPCDES